MDTFLYAREDRKKQYQSNINIDSTSTKEKKKNKRYRNLGNTSNQLNQDYHHTLQKKQVMMKYHYQIYFTKKKSRIRNQMGMIQNIIQKGTKTVIIFAYHIIKRATRTESLLKQIHQYHL